MSDKNIHQKNKYFFASFNNDRGLSLDDKTKDYVHRNTLGLVHSKICIFDRSNEKSHFSKTEIYFRKKTTPQLLEHIGL